MATKINPPTFSKAKSYELYKQEVLAWQEITDLAKEKQGVAIALSLPEDDDSQIREKVFSQVKLDDLKKEDGLATLITFLDKHLAKDDLTDSLEKFDSFDDFERKGDQSMTEFIAIFDAKYRKIEKKKMTLPPEILAFKLLKKANITKEEKLLVLTGMDFAKKDTLYEEAKKSLRKFKGGPCDTTGATGGPVTSSIKLEPAFLADHEEALLAAGYTKTRPSSYSWKRGWRGGRGGQARAQSWNGSQKNVGVNRGNLQNSRKNVNPTGPDGRLLTCKSCGSFRHLVANCPDSWENLAKVNISESDENTQEHVVLFTGFNKTEISRLGTDARNCAVLDSACSSTVCGETWIRNYMGDLDENDRSKIQYVEGKRMFKFGGGTCLKSKGEYSLPAFMAGKAVTIKTDVVESDIPLLLSRGAMKKAAVKMDLENDTAVIMGNTVALNLTSSGHYCIPIDQNESIPVENVCAVNLQEMDDKKRHDTLLKLHRQFAHPPRKRLVGLLKDAGIWRDDYEQTVSDIEQKCEMCKKYAKTPPKPVVSMPMAKEFNEKVAIDLKQWNGLWILHIIDMWSRYTVSVFISRKRPSDVIHSLMTNWIGVFGIMGAILTDNGGEFNSEEMREVASILNVKVCTTAAESPFQNGLCERVHAITDSMLMKLEADHGKVNNQALLCWANMAKNSLQMWKGFSSHQLVFGVSQYYERQFTCS